MSDRIAIVGMAGRFPGAASVDALWTRIRRGDSCLTTFSLDELRAAGVGTALLASPKYVPRRGVLDDADGWDAEFFGVSPREAELTDPQQRAFLECAWTALEDAGFDPHRVRQPAGVFAAVGFGTYLHHLVRAGAANVFGHTPLLIRNDKDYAASAVAYKLGLQGPAIAVQTACSSSLVAVHAACQSLLEGECDVALAGGATVRVPPRSGYLYEEGGIDSPDGCCRPFDAAANGTIAGDGVAVVVLVRLEDALALGDHIWAVIAGSAVTNDGSAKAGFTAPGVRGQTLAVHNALAASGRSSEEIGYVEAHGTGTRLGDPIEVRALTRAFDTAKRQYCALGSIKAQVGHLDAAAGVTGLVKAVLTLTHGEIPPQVNFTQANPEINFTETPFYVPTQLAPWPADNGTRCAGVSSFGIGGTNAHVVVEEAPPPDAAPRAVLPVHLIPVSARSRAALDTLTARLADRLNQRASGDLPDVAFTLATGRTGFHHRRFVVARDRDEARGRLADEIYRPSRTDRAAGTPPRVAFMFPGQQRLEPGSARELYAHVPVFRDWIDRASQALANSPCDLRTLLLGEERAGVDRAGAEAQLARTECLQPAMFAFQFALAQTWREWGVEPVALIGHSLGEYVAACLAGVFTFDDAVRLVAERGRLMQLSTPGGMWAVIGPVDRVRERLDGRWDLAAVNSPGACVVAAPLDAERDVQAWATEHDFSLVRLPASHAFHSRAMDPVLPNFRGLVKGAIRTAPSVPVISNVTGTWMSAEEATDAEYWVRHARETVQFDNGIVEIARAADLLVEIGPGHVLTSLAKVHAAAVPALDDRAGSLAAAFEGLGSVWLHGAAVDWNRFYAGRGCKRVRLPTYPFERTRYWYTAPPEPVHADAKAVRRSEPHGAGSLETIIARQVKLLQEQLALLSEPPSTTGRRPKHSART